MPDIEKIVVVTRKTRLQELVERFNTPGQAKFYLEQVGVDFQDYQDEADAYGRALDSLRAALDFGLKLQFFERTLVPTMLFTDSDLVVTAGQDGLVADVARYVGGRPLVAVNPDPRLAFVVREPFQSRRSRAGLVAGLLEAGHALRFESLMPTGCADIQRRRGARLPELPQRRRRHRPGRRAASPARRPARRPAPWP